MKKLTEQRKKEVAYLSASLAAITLIACLINWQSGVAVGVLGLVVLAVYYFFIISARQQKANEVYEVLKSLKTQKKPIVISDNMPSALTDERGHICWYNHAFAALCDETPRGKDVNELITDITRPDVDKQITLKGVTYTKEISQHKVNEKEYSLFRLIDEKNQEDIKNAYMGHMGVIAYIQIDNYEEIVASVSVGALSLMMGTVDNMISDFAAKVNGVLLHMDKDKYVLICERRHMGAAIDSKFSILQDVRNYKAEGQNATISIAFGVADTLSLANDFAASALDLAQSRGGDQAVIKSADKLDFYGGLQKGVEKRSRVKIRQFAKGLKNLMEQVSDVFVVGHVIPDMDSIGAALGIISCARSIGKTAYLVVGRQGESIQQIMTALSAYKEYEDVILNVSEAENMIKSTSMVVVVDTQIKSYLESPALVEKTEYITVIDHHFRGPEFIDNATLICHEPYASSTCELVAEIIQYFNDKPSLMPIEAEALLAGITIDTKGFTFKTGVRTFEAASFLRRQGADTISIKQLFQDDIDTFIQRAEIVKTAKISKRGIAIAAVPEKTPNAQLIAAQAADALLSIRGIIASFVLSKSGDTVVISGRSLGNVNVQVILEKLGGDGHPTIAGARIKDKDLKNTQRMLDEAIESYMQGEEE